LISESYVYTKMIVWYLSKQKWDKVFDVVEKMKEDDKVDRFAYYHMLRNALEHAPERVDVILQDMKDIGIPVDAHVYARYIEFYDNHNDEEKMVETFERMDAEGITPTEQAYTRLVARYIREGKYDKVLEVHKKMGEKDVKLNAFLLPSFLDAYAAKTLPANIYDALIGEVRAQPGAFLLLARKLANKVQKDKLAALDELQKKMKFGGVFKNQWEGHSRIRPNILQAWKAKQAEAKQ